MPTIAREKNRLKHCSRRHGVSSYSFWSWVIVFTPLISWELNATLSPTRRALNNRPSCTAYLSGGPAGLFAPTVPTCGCWIVIDPVASSTPTTVPCRPSCAEANDMVRASTLTHDRQETTFIFAPT